MQPPSQSFLQRLRELRGAARQASLRCLTPLGFTPAGPFGSHPVLPASASLGKRIAEGPKLWRVKAEMQIVKLVVE